MNMESIRVMVLMPQDDLDMLFIVGVLVGVAFLFGLSWFGERNRRV